VYACSRVAVHLPTFSWYFRKLSCIGVRLLFNCIFWKYWPTDYFLFCIEKRATGVGENYPQGGSALVRGAEGTTAILQHGELARCRVQALERGLDWHYVRLRVLLYPSRNQYNAASSTVRGPSDIRVRMGLLLLGDRGVSMYAPSDRHCATIRSSLSHYRSTTTCSHAKRGILIFACDPRHCDFTRGRMSYAAKIAAKLGNWWKKTGKFRSECKILKSLWDLGVCDEREYGKLLFIISVFYYQCFVK